MSGPFFSGTYNKTGMCSSPWVWDASQVLSQWLSFMSSNPETHFRSCNVCPFWETSHAAKKQPPPLKLSFTLNPLSLCLLEPTHSAIAILNGGFQIAHLVFQKSHTQDMDLSHFKSWLVFKVTDPGWSYGQRHPQLESTWVIQKHIFGWLESRAHPCSKVHFIVVL